MKKFFSSLSILLLLLAAGIVPALGAVQLPAKPATNIYVQDLANVISPEVEAQILQLGSLLDQKTTAQVAVVTVDSLQNMAIEEYATALFRSWGIGSKAKNNGVLILIAPNERQSRIEVGYGLEGALPDGKTGRIQDDYMLPYFQNGDYSSGAYNGYLAVAQVVAGEYQVDLSSAGTPVPATADAPASTQLPGWMIVLMVFGVMFLIFLDFKFFGGTITYLIFSSFRRGGGGGFGGGGGGFGGGSSGGGGSSRNW